MSNKGLKAVARGAEARIREVHAGKGALQKMDPPPQEKPGVLRAKAELKAAVERLTKRR